MNQIQERRFGEILFFGLIFLIFFQLIADFIEVIYSTCLLTTGLNETVAAVLFILAPLLLCLAGKKLPELFAVLSIELAIICRMVEVTATPGLKIIISGCGVGMFLLFFPVFLNNVKQSKRDTRGVVLGLGLILSVLTLILFKSVNASIDITRYGSLWIGWIICGLAAILAPYIILTGDNPPRGSARRIFGKKQKEPGIFLPAWGIMSVFAMIYFLFGSPTVLARWVQGNYVMIVAVQIVMIAIFGINSIFNPGVKPVLSKPILVIWNLFFIAVLVGFIYSLQIQFPIPTDAYPLFAPESTLADSVLLYLLLILSPILFVNMMVFSGQIINTDLSIRRVGLGFFLACFLFLVLIFSHIFTTVYDYIPVVGPFFRDAYWFVYLAVGVGLLIPMMFNREELTEDRNIPINKKDKLFLTILVILLVGLVLIGIDSGSPSEINESAENRLKIMTYNIQQGYSEQGLKNYDSQIELIRAQDPDILGLQESDSLRIAGANADLTRYYANALNMYSYNGPSPVTGTFGIALLSKYPIQNPQTFFMHSIGEQTATIKAEITKGNRTYKVYVTHLGNDGDLVQQQAILSDVGDQKNVILMGDFNFRPDTEQYKLTTNRLSDSWLTKWPDGIEGSGTTPEAHAYGRIDHIFLSPEIEIRDSRFLFSHHSDHPALITEIEN